MTDSWARPIDLSRLYRANIAPHPATLAGNQRTIFVEADNAREARSKVIALISVIDCLSYGTVDQRLCEVSSARRYVKNPDKPDGIVRLFDGGLRGGGIVSEPVFLIGEPAGLIRRWIERIEQNRT